MIADIANPYYVHLLDGMHQEFRAAGYHVLLLIDPVEVQNDPDAYGRLLDQDLDGLVITTATVDSTVPQALHDRGLPIVLAARSVPGAEVDTVVSDNFSAGRDAAEHIVDLGHEAIAVILGPGNTTTSRERDQGISAALSERGLHIREEYRRAGTYAYETGYSQTMDLLSLSPTPTAIICANDVIALGALEAARKRKVSIPEDLSVIGFDDIPMAAWESFRLTTVRQPTADLSRSAAQTLVGRIADPRRPVRTQVFPMSLVVRSTTATPQAGR